MRLSPSEAPKPPKVKESFLTYCFDRNPRFKIHDDLRQASTALSYHMPNNKVALYKMQDGEWACIFYYVPSDECDICGGSLVDRTTYSYPVTTRRQRQGTPRYQQPVVCYNCY